MNREIKFRGKRVDNGEWVYGDGVYINRNAGLAFILIDGGTDEGARKYVIPETVGQYTGLKDKNGKEIYEGDIMDYGHNRVFYISYVACQFVATFSERVVNTMIPIQNFEIIGNIHETPELIAQ